MYRIILVDDEPMVLRGLSLAIKETGLPLQVVCETDNGQNALAYINTYPVDIVITDVQMPEMNGIQFAQTLFLQYTDILVVVLSGYDNFTYAQELIRNNVKDYLLKPVKTEELQRAMQRLITTMGSKNNVSPSLKKYLANLILNEATQNGITIQTNIYKHLEYEFSILSKEERYDLFCETGKQIHQIFESNYGAVIEKIPPLNLHDLTGVDEDITLLQQETYSVLQKITSQTSSKLIKDLTEFVKLHCRDEYTLEDLAGKFGYNPNYLSHIFKTVTGKSFTKYRNTVRIEKAKTLLIGTQLPIAEIGMEVGYSDIAYFIRVFKNLTSETPGDFRRTRRANIRDYHY